MCKIFGPKIRPCKFFDKSQVCQYLKLQVNLISMHVLCDRVVCIANCTLKSVLCRMCMQCYLNYHGKWCSALFVECQAVNFQWGCSWCQVFARCKIFASEIPNSHFHTSSNQSCIIILLFTLLLVLTVKSVKKTTNHDILTKRYHNRCTEQILSQLEVQAMQVGIIIIFLPSSSSLSSKSSSS